MAALRMMNSEPDTQSARELVLFIENDGDLYRQQHTPINKNLATKKAKGVYDHAKAVKLFGHLVESGAKKYNKEFGGGGSVWNEMFDVATRKQAAEELTNTFESEYDNGQYVSLLPKKYQKNPVVFRRENGGVSSTHWHDLGKKAAASGKYRDVEEAMQALNVPQFQAAPFTRGFYGGAGSGRQPNGRTSTPKFVWEMGGLPYGVTPMEWHTRSHFGHHADGPITDKNLEKAVMAYTVSTYPGYANEQIGQQYGIVMPTWAKIRENFPGGRVLAEWRAPSFQVLPEAKDFPGLHKKRNPDDCEGDMIDDDEDEEQIDIDPDDDVDDGDDDDEYEDDILTQAQVELESDSLTIQCDEEGDYYIEDERTGQCWDVFDTGDGFEFEEQ